MMLVDRLHESDHGWRWRTLAGSVIVTSACGLLYAFGLYSSELQRAANLTQAQLDLTVAMSQTGGNLGLHLGIMYDRVGPAPTLLFGAAFGTTIGLGAVAFGLFLMLCLLLVSRREEPPLCAAPHAAAVRLVGSDDAPEAESASTPSRAALGVALLPRAREDVSLWQACLRSETYGLFIIETLIAGAGLVVINNLAQILTARAGDARSAATFVSLTSTGNAAGRLAVGAVGDHLVHRRRRSRTYALALAAALMLVGHLTLLIPGGSEALYVPCLLVGVAYGGMSAVIPPILAETFGTCQLAAIYALVCMGFALGLLLFASALVARVYEAAKAAAGISDDEPCVGMPCFRVTYVVCAAASAVAMLLALALASRESRRVD